MTSKLDHIRDQQRQTWDRFSVGWRSWDALVGGWLAPVGETMMRHATLPNDADVLDVASGTGEPGLTAAAMVPHGRVTLTDLSEQMLAVASTNAADRRLLNVDPSLRRWHASLRRRKFRRRSVPFWIHVLPRRVRSRQRIRPGGSAGWAGRVVAAVWSKPDTNPWATTIMSTIARHVTLPPSPPNAPGLFRCAPDGYMRTVFARAGLRDVTAEEVSFDLVHDSGEQYWKFMTDVAAPVVAGLAHAGESRTERNP